MRRSTLFATLLLAGCASLPLEEKWAFGVVAADLATTAYALEHGAEELNPIFTAGSPSDDEIMARALVLNVALLWLAHAVLEDYPRRIERKGWRLVLALRAVPVAWNLSQIGELD